jgi:hypothetical protein
MSCTGYWSTKDGCCKKCHKPTPWTELKQYKNVCLNCSRVKEIFDEIMEALSE